MGRQVTKDYDEFIIRLSELSGMVFHSKIIYKNYLKETKKTEKESLFYLGSRLSFYSPLNGKLVKDGDNYEVTSENIEDKVILLQRRLCNYYSAHGYEVFESFLRTITSRLIVKYNKKAIEYDQRLGFRNVKSCKIYLASQYRDNLDLLKLLRRIMPNLSKAFEEKKDLQNYFHFYKVYSQVRHAIIHSNSLLSDDTIKKLSKEDIVFLDKYFRANKKSNEIDTVNNIDALFEGLGVMAYLILTSVDFKYPKQREH